MQLLVEDIADGVVLLDADGGVLDTNAAAGRLFGETIPTGITVSMLTSRYNVSTLDGVPLLVDRLLDQQASRRDPVRGAEVTITRPDGTLRHLAVSVNPVVLAGGKPGFLLILHDISDRVHRDREASAFRILSQQLASAEHDLRAVYWTVVTHIAEITGATVVRLMLYDADARVLTRAAIHGGHDEQSSIALHDDSLEALAARTRLPVVVPDFKQYRPDNDATHGGSSGARDTGSAIAVPLIVHSELIGTLSYDLPEPHLFDDAEIAFLGTIATQSAVAIHNATLLQQRNRERVFLSEIIDHLPACLVVFKVVRDTVGSDARQRLDYRVTMLNALAANHLPVALASRIGSRRHGDSRPRIRRLAADEQSQKLLAWLDAAVSEAELVTAEEVFFRSYTTPPGQTGSLSSYWSGAIVPLKGANGQVSELVLLATDVTEQVATRRRVEELVQVAGSRAAEIEATVSAMTDAVTVCDATGRIRLANRASLDTYGVETLAELLRTPAFDERIHLRHTDGQQVQPEARPLARALAGETLQADFTLFHHGMGRDVHRRTNAAPVRDANGAIIGAVAVETDITSLIEVDRLKDEFFSMAAHELRTPLTAIKGYLQILSRQLAQADPLSTRALSILREQGDRMERLINELLDVARIESGQLEFRYRDVDLIALLKQLITEFSREAQGHTIELSTGPDEVIGRWDEDRLAQVFSNLLANAVKYSPDGGRIQVSVAWYGEPGDTITVAVADEGIGIPPEQIPRLFARYSRIGDGAHFRQSGLGLGLYISKQIIDSHGGSIRVQSDPGRGSTFTVSLPIRPKSAERGRTARHQTVSNRR
jgi:two-component system, OmpR family, phosphate regulon sensor histidine kinase PhoR